jgi:hypothetical protein
MLRDMETNRDNEIIDILRKHFHPDEEGWLWLAIRPVGAERGVLSQIEGERPDAHAVIQGFTEIFASLGRVEIVIVICRAGGRPFEADRELWRALRSRFDGTETRLVDAVVFNRESTWSMREEDARTNAVAS